MIKKFINAVQFLTVIPVNKNIQTNPEDLAKSTIFFPLVGIIIGSFLVITNELLSLIFSNLLVSVFILITEIIISCGFHLDGLVDTFDGIFSGFKNKERIVEIMKDSRVGGMGVIFLFLFLFLKFSLIYELSPVFKNKVLLLMPVFGRWMAVFGARFYESVKRGEESLAEIYTDYVSNFEFIVATIFILVLSFLIFGFNSVLFWVIIFIFNLYFYNYINSKIGGITGDILGASCEITEILFLITGVLL